MRTFPSFGNQSSPRLGIASSVTLHVARCLYGEIFREVTETSYEKVTLSESETESKLGIEKEGKKPCRNMYYRML